MNRAKNRILVVDDERETCELIAALLQREGIVPLLAYDGKTAMQIMREQWPEALILDIMLPDLDGLEVLRQVKALDEDLPVVILTGHPGVRGAVAAMRASAYDYLSKPYDHAELLRVARRALQERQFSLRRKHAGAEGNAHGDLAHTMGPSGAIARLIAEVNCVAKSNFSVVILGETGTGKEVVARAIHQASPRANRPFVPVDCGAIPETLIEAELFGHEKGAFTGALSQKPGRFEQAAGGTLLLDEVSNMPLSAQAKVLRALQERTVYRVGGTAPIKVDARVLAAGNRDLEAVAAAGRFRVDLFFRLNEFTLRVPPLRQRQEDILYLAGRFLDQTNQELNKRVSGFSEPATQALLNYSWPGNVRQLRSTVRRAVLLAEEVVAEAHLDIMGESGPAPSPPLLNTFLETPPGACLSLKKVVAQSTVAVEREVLLHALRRTSGNKAEAARLLQIDYKTIQSKIKKCGIPSNPQAL